MPEPPVDYTGVGATLRAARERTGVAIGGAAAALKVQASHLDAIEQGRFAELPGQVYVLGFVRSYAEYLGFDGDAAVRRLKEELSDEAAQKARLTFPVPVSEARTPGRALVLAALLIAAAIYGVWVYWGHVTTGTVELVPPLPERLAKLIHEPRAAAPVAAPASAPTPAVPPVAVAPPPAPAVPAAVAPPPAAPPPAPAVTPPAPPPSSVAMLAPAPPAQSTAGDRAPSAPLVSLAPVGAEVVPPKPPPAPPPAPVAAPPPSFPVVPAESAAAAPAPPTPTLGAPAAESRVTLRAKSISWVQVRGGDNEILVTRTLRAGDTYALPNRSDMVMMTGSAGGLEVLIDGKPIPPLGNVGEVRRNIPLDPERLLRLVQPQ